MSATADIVLSNLCHQMAMTIGQYIIDTDDLSRDDQKTLLDYKSKLSGLASDFIDEDVDDILTKATIPLKDIQSAITNANNLAAEIDDTQKIITLVAATAALGFAIFTGISTGSFGGITGALSDLVSAVKPLIAAPKNPIPGVT